MRFPAVLLFAIALAGANSGRAQSVELIQAYQRYQEAREAGDLGLAISNARETLNLVQQTYGESDPELIAPLEGLAEVLSLSGNFDAAGDSYQRALRIREQQQGTDHPDLIPTLEALERIRRQQNAFTQVEGLLNRILDIERASYGQGHDNTVATLRRLQLLYEDTGRPIEAAAVDETIESALMVARELALGADGRRYTADEGFATVRVFYGTNRQRSGIEKPAQFYGTQRGDLEQGYLDVSIPATHKYGELETASRWSIFTYILGEDSKKKRYVLLLKVAPLDENSFFRQLQNQISESPSADVLLFIHGYNSTFEDAAKRAAQLAYDLDFDGTPMLYSWPSQASTAAYTVDEASVRISGKRMASFLEGVVAQSGAQRIHLIAHSMGNRALIEALQTYLMRNAPEAGKQIFGQVVFTAPDVDRDYFVDAMDTISGTAARVTLYTSDNDIALQTSSMLHGAPRAGMAGDTIVTLPGLDTIDMSAVEADLLGHTYFATNEGAIYDLFRLLWRDEPPPQRCGMDKEAAGNSGFWSFNVERCAGSDVLEAGLLLKRFGQKAHARVRARIEALTDSKQNAAKEEWGRILDRLDTLLEDSDQ